MKRFLKQAHVMDKVKRGLLRGNITIFPKDSNANGKENEEISEASTCDGQGEEGTTEGQPHNIFYAIKFLLLRTQ